jgi:hypothetical protein
MMGTLMQSFDRHDEFERFDPETGRHVRYSKQENPSEWNGKPDGWYAIVEGEPIRFYHKDHELQLEYKGKTYPLGEGTMAAIKKGNGGSTFTLQDSGKCLLSIHRRSPQSSIPPDMDFTQTDPEHFDFLLFIANMLNSSHRRRFAMGYPLER